MDTKSAALDALYTGFKASFNRGFDNAPTEYQKISMTVPSATREETYAWMGAWPGMREFIGDRATKSLGMGVYTIKNSKFESTVSIPRDKISDDQFGVYTPIFEEMGRVAKGHPDEMIFSLLAKGFQTNCYDGQYFFDVDHPFFISDDVSGVVSNMQAGTSPAWFLLDTTRAMKPLIWQTREDYKFTTLSDDRDANVFYREEYIYGIRARVNAGFGLWQLAFGSKAPLNAANYVDARKKMGAYVGDRGRKLGIVPNVLVVGPSNEEAGRSLLKATQNGGTSNIWADSAQLIVTSYLD
jgi:phage major head subunit gpT-like protein